MNIKRQTVLMYLYEAALCFRMVDAVWVIFLLERGFSLAQVGIAEGVYHITSLIFEVPSGMAADLFGRKRTLIMSGIVGICSAIFMTLEGWAGFVYCGMVFSAFSLNLASGTEEALIYDSLLEAGCADRYKKVWGNSSMIGRTTAAIACLASPVAIGIGFRHTYHISAALYLCTIVFLLFVKEPAVTDEQKIRYGQTEVKYGQAAEKQKGQCLQKKTVYAQIKSETGRRWRQHIRRTGVFIRENPKTMFKLFADAAIACPCYLIMMYLQEHLVNCGFPKSFIGIPMFVIPLAGAVGTKIAGKNRSGLKRALLLCSVIGGIGTCLVGSNALVVVLIGAGIQRICEGFSEITVSENVNREFSSDYRATLVSVGSMCYSLLMVAASPVTGFVGERCGVNAAFYLLGGMLLAATAVTCLITGRRKSSAG